MYIFAAHPQLSEKLKLVVISVSRLFTAHYHSLCAAVTSTRLNSHIQCVDIISDRLILFYCAYYIKLFYCFPCLLFTLSILC